VIDSVRPKVTEPSRSDSPLLYERTRENVWACLPPDVSD